VTLPATNCNGWLTADRLAKFAILGIQDIAGLGVMAVFLLGRFLGVACP
jgi:hypothetical protein